MTFEYRRNRNIDPLVICDAEPVLRSILDGNSPFGAMHAGVVRKEHPHGDASSAAHPLSDIPSPASPATATPTWPELLVEAGRTMKSLYVGRTMLILATDLQAAGYEEGEGVTLSRLRDIMVRAGIDNRSIPRFLTAMYLWMDAAHLMESCVQQRPWDAPRHLTVRDLDAIQARIHATPPPTPEEIAEAKRLGMK